MNPILSTTFHIVIFHGLLTVYGADPLPVASTNPNLAVEQVILKFFGNKDPDSAATCGQLIESRGFKFERYYVTTEDGYILQNFRIINPYAREARKKLKPVLLLHPFLTACSIWLENDPGGHIKPWIDGNPPDDDSNALGFLLANLGYDVWLINIRGTSYSTNHTNLDPYADTNFWDFSFYEVGVYDVTATVEHIKNVTQFESIIVVGYSQGTAQLLIQLSAMPEYEKNYDLVILAAPIGFMADKNSITNLVPTELLRFILTLNGPFPHLSPIVYASIAVICNQPLFQGLCAQIYELSVGYDPQQLNSSRIAVYASLLDQSSNKVLRHYTQFIEKDHLSYYDYGKEKNKVLYGSPESPEFPFYKINASKVVLISALNDIVATPIKVQKLRDSFDGKTRGDYVVNCTSFNHGDFVLAIDSYSYFGKLVSQIIGEQVSNLSDD